VPAPAGQPASSPRATTPQVHQAVERAIQYLQFESADWLNTRKCAACHHVPMPLWALGEAQRRGYVIDTKFVAATAESLMGSKDKLLASKIFPDPAAPPDPRPQGRGLNMGLPMLAVAARSLPSLTAGQERSLELIAEEIIKKQQPDGSWEFFATLRRPPINESQTTDAAWIVMALQGATGPDATESRREALAKAVAWLDGAKRSEIHQDKVLKVILEVRAGAPREALRTTIDGLLALQRADGGWSQTVPDLKSDAFATGQTLYALSLAGFTAGRPEIQRGIDFLVATQKPDGSWPMTSRATPDGSPGGAKLLTPITCAASSWATLGLARLAPRDQPESKAESARDAPESSTRSEEPNLIHVDLDSIGSRTQQFHAGHHRRARMLRFSSDAGPALRARRMSPAGGRRWRRGPSRILASAKRRYFTTRPVLGSTLSFRFSSSCVQKTNPLNISSYV
jgi:hypothetical protein